MGRKKAIKIPFNRRLYPGTFKKLKADARKYGVNETVYLELLILGKIQSKDSGAKR